MAEINYNNLYNQLNPMEKRYYDQQFSKNYVPGQENIMLSSQPAYEQMKAAYEAQQQIPEKSFFDSLNLFGSASAAEKPTVPNLSLGYNMPTFDLATGITNTTSASPFINTADILNQYNVPNSTNQNLVDAIIAENQRKVSQFDPRNFQSIFPTNVQTGITQQAPLQDLGIDTSYGIANEPDVEQVDYLPGQPKSFRDSANLKEYFENRDPLSGIMKVLRNIPSPTNLLLNLLPKQDPRETNIRNFYGNQYGLTSTGSLASGIMQGYNPVYGSNFLNKLTGGKLPASSFGLADAARRRIEKIANRKRAQTEASRAKIAALQKFAERDTISRARFDNRNVYRDARDRGTLGPGGGFSTSGKEGAFSSKSGRGRKDF